MHDVLIIGSGVIGMSIARQLSATQYDVAIVDRDVPGKHASYKAGGMLGAQNEFTEESDLFNLAIESRGMFPLLSESLMNETGIDIQFQDSGLIKIAHSKEDVESLQRQYNFLKQNDPSVKQLSSEDLMHLTNGNVKPSYAAIHIPHDGQINANAYTKALLESLNMRRISRYHHTEVQSIERNNGYYSVYTDQQPLIEARKVIVAGGAWSSQLLKNYNLQRKVIGVKGEVLLLENDDLNLSETLFMTNGCYIVPKQPNRFLIGATSEYDNYSVGTTKKGLNWLFNHACERIPELKHSRILKEWSGVRPYTDNEVPMMDQIDDGLFVITGHYRNGILLSPIIGRDIANWLISGIKPPHYSSFSVSRRNSYEVYH
ncbi:glycine oxidase ThiO [Staphylococcus caprae]|uniref:glycine oxidase ThiO n=1 Tax=Staphylococcus caprae TaxID=29380 RepID=UPI003B225E98